VVKKVVEIGNCFLAVILGIIIVNITRTFYIEKSKINLVSPPSVSYQPQPGVAKKFPPYKYYAANILMRNLFNIPSTKVYYEKNEREKTFPSKGKSNLPTTNLKLALKGTVVTQSEGGSWAIIEILPQRKQRLYRKGELVWGAKIEAIERRKIILRKGDAQEVLFLNGREKTGRVSYERKKVATLRRFYNRRKESYQKQKKKELSSVASPKVELGKIVVNKKTKFFDLVNQAKQILIGNSITPYFVDGKLSGYQIRALSSNNPLFKLGIRKGDIIKEVNGVVIDKPEKIINAYLSSKNTHEIEVVIERQGKKEVLRYKIDEE